MRIGFFATSNIEVIEKVLPEIRKQFAEADEIVAYVRTAFQHSLGAKLDGFTVRSDGMKGRHLGFLRDVRREHYHGIVVIFGGGSDHWKMKLLSHMGGARHLYVFNENGNFFEWNRQSWPIVKQHLKWRWSHAAGPQLGSSFTLQKPWISWGLRLYSLTLGPLIGLFYLVAATLGWESRRWFRRLVGRTGDQA